MASMSINAVNIYPNRYWYVYAKHDGSGTLDVKLYKTLDDLNAETNYAGHAAGVEVGTQVEVVFSDGEVENLPIYNNVPTSIGFYYEAMNYHILLTSELTSPDQKFKLKPFTDLDEIRDPIYQNSTLARVRKIAEINFHTHALISTSVALASHLPTLESGDIVKLSSSRRGVTNFHQVMRHEISGNMSIDSPYIRSTLELARYVKMERR